MSKVTSTVFASRGRAENWKAFSGSRKSSSAASAGCHAAWPTSPIVRSRSAFTALDRWPEKTRFRIRANDAIEACMRTRSAATRSAYRRPSLAEEPTPGQHHRQIVAASGVRRQHEERAKRIFGPHSENEWANEVDGRLQRQHFCNHLQPRRHLRDRKIDAGKKGHRRDDEREVVGEEVVALGNRVEDEPDRRERDAGQAEHRQGQEHRRRPADTEHEDDDKDRGARKERLD